MRVRVSGLKLEDEVHQGGVYSAAEFNYHVAEAGGLLASAAPGGERLVRLYRDAPLVRFEARHLTALPALQAPGAEESDFEESAGRVPLWALRRLAGHLFDAADLVPRVLAFLIVRTVDPAHVKSCGASSCMGGFSNHANTTKPETEESWWVSAAGSCPNGVGREWVAFDLGDARRIRFVSVRIPPLPSGPLSVRTFHLETCIDGGGVGAWRAASPEFTTLDTGELQEFQVVPAVDARFVRLVCSQNAVAHLLDHRPELRVVVPLPNAIGLFEIGFR
ncbi:hypothetical protein M885DRAFT_509416 [Pelagophyceae sp. CCMP2097]|nr:hypothetical protein M885DRAFT_509416 [Pelagophyceae sp. CCMP2097]